MTALIRLVPPMFIYTCVATMLALGIGLGFGVLVLSQVPSNARLGALVVVSVVGCLVFSLILLPCLLTILFGKKSELLVDDS